MYVAHDENVDFVGRDWRAISSGKLRLGSEDDWTVWEVRSSCKITRRCGEAGPLNLRRCDMTRGGVFFSSLFHTQEADISVHV